MQLTWLADKIGQQYKIIVNLIIPVLERCYYQLLAVSNDYLSLTEITAKALIGDSNVDVSK